VWADHLGELDEIRFARFGGFLLVLKSTAFERAAREVDKVDARFLELDA
jgi:hypothetical protein